MATVKLENIYKSFDETEVLFDINLEIKDKEFVVFVGPFRLWKNHIIKNYLWLRGGFKWQGKFDDDNVTVLPVERRNVGMVFQSYALYPHICI